MSVVWCSTTKNIPQFDFSCSADCCSTGLFVCGHIRQTVNSRAALIPHSTLLPLVFDSTKDVLVSRSSAISAPLSSAKHKFTAHSCTEVSYCCSMEELLHCCSVLYYEVRSDCYRKQILPFFTLACSTRFNFIRNDVQVFGPVCSFCSAQYVHNLSLNWSKSTTMGHS